MKKEKFVLEKEKNKLEGVIFNLTKEKENFIIENIRYEEVIRNLKEKLEFEGNNFKNIASNIIEQNQEKMFDVNQKNLNVILSPLKDEIEKLKKQIVDTHMQDEKSRFILQDHIKQIYDSSEHLRSEANNLVEALNGNKKIQGIWGELQLENLLKISGLKYKIDYVMQKSYDNFDNDVKKIPDCIINMPDNRQIVIDSKVTLNSYQKYFNSTDKEDKENYLKIYIENIKRHIQILSSKEYYKIDDLKTIDFVVMFIPIDSAFSIILENNTNIFEYAFKNNIIIASPSTLFALCKTISFLWKQDTLNKSREEIFKIAEKMYNKFRLFIEDMQDIEKNLNNCKEKYDSAMNKLQTSTRRGETLVGLADMLKELGVSHKEEISIKEKIKLRDTENK